MRERTTLKQSPSKKAGKQWQFCHLHETKNRLEVLARFNFCSFRTQDFGSWLLNFEILPQRHSVLFSMFERPRRYLISHWKTRVGRDLKLERFTLSCSTPIHPRLWRPLVCVFWSWPLWDVTILMRLWSVWLAMCGRGHPGEGTKENNGSMGLISCGGGKSPTKKIEVLLRNLRGPAVFKTRISILLYRWSRWCGCRINYLQRRVRPQGRWTYC